MNTLYSLRKSRHILLNALLWHKKKKDKLSPEDLKNLNLDIQSLDEAIKEKDRKQADKIARKLEAFGKARFKKGIVLSFFEVVFALIFALAIATAVRQMWFELYEIPTGSMRPTFKEQDHLSVSKLSFGINIPLKTAHFYFDPKLVERTGIVIWSGDGIALPNTNATYFGIIPYTKRYIKRMIGKPGDSLYFYGGKIYGVDKDGLLIAELLDSPWMDGLEHIPFMSFQGDPSSKSFNEVFFPQMHQPAGKLSLSSSGELIGEVYNGTEWIKDDPTAQASEHSTIKTYSDLYGIRNFAMARLLSPRELKYYPSLSSPKSEEGILYLELQHSPSLSYPKPFFKRSFYDVQAALAPYTTIIPLQQKHLDALMENMYTARFVVKNGRAARYSLENFGVQTRSPKFADVPDGTYEFYYGKGYSIGWGGIASPLSSDHPLYRKDPENVERLFNLGIDFDTVFSPSPANQIIFPHRYAYFREGDLYLLGGPIFKKDDPLLISFNEQELLKESASEPNRPYVAFKDFGPPIKNGKVDVEFIKTFGITVPEKHYFVLGDNHAMSADSRSFGFVPEDNLQGAPSLTLWPPNKFLQPPMQKPYQIITIPRLIIWTSVSMILLVFFAVRRYRLKKLLDNKYNE